MFSGTGSRLRDAIGLCLVVFVLASCGGGGGGGSSTPAPGSKLFVSDGGNHAIGSVINAAPTQGSTFNIDRIVQGSSTGLGTLGGTPSVSSIPSMALDAPNDRLFASTQLSLAIFDNASLASGNIPFSRRVTGLIPPSAGGPRGVNFLYIDVDKTNDRLYSVDPAGEVHVYNGISALNGTNLAPNRIITGDFGGATVNNVFGIAIDPTRNLLYVGLQLNTTQTIAVFASASSADTTNIAPLAPTKQLTFTFGIGSIFLDVANDRLYLSQFDGKVLVLDSASGLAGGAPAANRTIDLTGGFAIQFYIFVDTSRNKLYAVGNQQGATAAQDQGFVLIIDNASTANDVPPGGPNASDGLGTNIVLSNIRLSAVAVKP